MAIKKYNLLADNTITNAFKENLLTRGTGSNMGASDILEAFVIQGQTSASISATNAEQMRILLRFDVDAIQNDISSGVLPSSSVDYILRLYNAPHGGTTPLSYSLDVAMGTRAWTEGRGLDMEEFTDAGESNWIFASDSVEWDQPGGDYLGNAGGDYSASYFFSGGMENLDLNINFLMDRWRSGEYQNYGLLIKYPDNIISGSEGTFYTKKFFSRTSDYFLNRPCVEARWDSSRQDDRGNTYLSSALAPASDNLNSLFLYNRIRGQFKNIPGLEAYWPDQQKLLVSFYSGSSGSPSGSKLVVVNKDGEPVTNITGGLVYENGIPITGSYSCSFAITSSFESINDVWFSGSTQYFTGSFSPSNIYANEVVYGEEYTTSISNLKSSYMKGQKERLRIFAKRNNRSSLNIYTVANTLITPTPIEESYYRLYRDIDNMEIIAFGTGSNKYTKLSYDMSGNYFDLDTSYLEPGYMYSLQFLYNIDGQYKEQPEIFKFRVQETSP
jgi:hypothetical protein